ncbi:MAG: hydantoinase B/oxoprolinase family protein [Actinobacteria bacterium]|nr:hydantoinase B/oxoprolinase family protein [Actinomycetota bacterium]
MTAEQTVAVRLASDRDGGADPVTTEVIRYGLEAAAEQMRVSLCRSAFSPAIYDGLDFGAALYDREVRLLSQAKAMPGFLGTLGFCIEAMVGRVGGPEALREGDVVFSTYGYDIGSHQQDAVVVVPGFFEGELVGYAVIKAHHLDIGAKAPYCTDTTDIFQEGTIFPGVRIYSAGVRNEDLYRTILANSRAPEVLAGDLNAQIGSARVGLRELNRLLERFGRTRFEAAVERILDHGERVVRNFLAGVPDGRYSASGALDDNAVDPGVPVPLEVVVDVRGDEISIDLSESADQQRGPVNSPAAVSVGMVCVAVATLAGVEGGVNGGYFRPIDVKTRPGSIFEPIAPAPIFLYGWAGTYAIGLVHRALADTLPDIVPADNGFHGGMMMWGSDERDGLWLVAAMHAVGMGASARGDMTTPLLSIALSGLTTIPAEIQELTGHVVVERFELIPDTGGAGRLRGGLGVRGRYRARDPQVLMVLLERTQSPPWGLRGGGDGRPNSASVLLPDGTVQDVFKVPGMQLPAGAVAEYRSGGGGGFGPPSERDPEAVLHDVREGYVTEEAARRDYPHAFAQSEE